MDIVDIMDITDIMDIMDIIVLMGSLHNPLDLSKVLSATLCLFCGGSSTTLSSTRFFPYFFAFYFPFFLLFSLAGCSGSEFIDSL